MQPGKDESWGLYLNASKKGQAVQGNGTETVEIAPDPLGRLRHSTGPMYSHMPRKLPIHAVIDDSVFDRMQTALPVYAPQSLFDLNDDLVKKRSDLTKEVARLEETNSLGKEDCERILNWSHQKLSLMKWSKYLEFELEDNRRLKDHLNPAIELSNPVPRV